MVLLSDIQPLCGKGGVRHSVSRHLRTKIILTEQENQTKGIHLHFELRNNPKISSTLLLSHTEEDINIVTSNRAAVMDVSFSTSAEGMNCILKMHHSCSHMSYDALSIL